MSNSLKLFAATVPAPSPLQELPAATYTQETSSSSSSVSSSSSSSVTTKSVSTKVFSEKATRLMSLAPRVSLKYRCLTITTSASLPTEAIQKNDLKTALDSFNQLHFSNKIPEALQVFASIQKMSELHTLDRDTSCDLYFKAALSYYSLKDYQNAFLFFDKALNYSPSSPIIQGFRADALFQLAFMDEQAKNPKCSSEYLVAFYFFIKYYAALCEKNIPPPDKNFFFHFLICCEHVFNISRVFALEAMTSKKA